MFAGDDPSHDPPDPQPGGVELAPGVVVPEGALRWSYSRSSGPGGQNVNKRSTQAELRVALADLPIPDRVLARLRRLAGSRVVGAAEGEEEILLSSDEHRSQRQNRQACLDRLRDLLIRAAARPRRRIPTRPSKGAKRRRREARERHKQKKRRRGWRPDE